MRPVAGMQFWDLPNTDQTVLFLWIVCTLVAVTSAAMVFLHTIRYPGRNVAHEGLVLRKLCLVALFVAKAALALGTYFYAAAKTEVIPTDTSFILAFIAGVLGISVAALLLRTPAERYAPRQ